MARAELACIECGHRSLKWHGRCPQCAAWGSLAEEAAGRAGAEPVRLDSLPTGAEQRIASGLGELDRVLGGGIVPGSVVLLAGEPGVGKSTLALHAAAGFRRGGRRVVLVCGEESLEQVAVRARRLDVAGDVEATSETDAAAVCSRLEGASVGVIDSIQTLRDPSAGGDAGSPAQVRAAAARLARWARASGTALLLVGHVTKDGAVAGPRALEHLVDAVFAFEGDRYHALRTLRSSKNRFGTTSELGLFEMTEAGLREVPDASGLFLQDRLVQVPGSCAGCALEGRRPVSVEVQALLNPVQGPARITVTGLDQARIAMVMAVLDARCGIQMGRFNAFVQVAGGYRGTDQGLDLAVGLALASAARGKPVPPEVAAFGELGLGGEVRAVPAMAARVTEARRLGFQRIIGPRSAPAAKGIEVCPASDLNMALSHVN